MASIYDVMFFIQFMIFIGILFAQIYNTMKIGKFYTFAVSIILFSLALLMYGIGYVAFLTNPLIEVDLIYPSLFQLQGWLLPLLLIFFFIEILFVLGDNTPKPRQAFTVFEGPTYKNQGNKFL